MLKRKGVSEVVANVLIVLLVIVGIAVIWSVVKPTIDKGAKGIQSDCITLSVDPVKCVLDASGGSNVIVTVKRNTGLGVFSAVEFIFENATATERVGPATAITGTMLSELNTKDITVTPVMYNPSIRKVNAVLKDGNGNLCQVISQPVDCK